MVGNADWTGARHPSSNVLDQDNLGILTIYANGVDAVTAQAEKEVAANNSYVAGGDQSWWNSYPPGTSQATAQVAGLVAYYLSDPVLQHTFASNGIEGVPQAVKSYLLYAARENKGGVWPEGDNVPRASAGERVPCPKFASPANGPALPLPSPAARTFLTNRVLSTETVWDGSNIVYPAQYLVRYSLNHLKPIALLTHFSRCALISENM